MLNNFKFRNKNFIYLFLIYTICTLISLYLAEYYFYNEDKKLLKNISKYKFYKNNYEKSKNTIYHINPFLNIKDNSLINYLPLSGVSNHFTVTCNENGYFGKYLSDRYGFNNRNEIWNEKFIDYLIVGDSFSLGSCVSSDQTIQHNIEKLTNSSVLNLSLGGNGPLLKFATMREYFKYVEVKKVVWFFYEGNDLLDLKDENKSKLLKKYLDDPSFNQNLYNNQDKNDLILLDYFNRNKSKLKYKNTTDFVKLKRLREKIYFKKKINQIKIPSNFLKIILEAKKLSEKNNSEFYFVYLPTFNRFIGGENIYPYKKLIDLLIKNKINLIDLQKIYFSKKKFPLESFPNKKKGHYTAETYKQISNIVINEIKKYEEKK